MKSFFVRAGSALVFAAIMVACLLTDWKYASTMLPISVSLFLPLNVVLAWGCLREYFQLTRNESDAQPLYTKLNIALGSLLVLKSYFFCQRWPSEDVSVIFPFFLALLMVLELFRKSERPLANLGRAMLGHSLITLPLLIANNIYFKFDGVFLFAIFWLIWCNDTGAYIIGSLLGRHKMMERISPKKTWEGVVGGLVVTLVFAWVFTKIPQLNRYGLWQWMVMAATIFISGTFGDLVESMIKRNAGVKDSGSMMPGHGGFLDRFDAYLLTLPFVAVAIWVIYQLETLLMVLDYLK